jgi:tetratricopeptide (TPR) repeat protein
VVKYRDTRLDPASAGIELKVDAVLDGAIQRSEARIRVTVQLISVGSGAPLWADKFDEMFTDIFAVEDSISQQVARALTLRLTGEERTLLGKRYTENPEAYELYLKGRYLWNKRTAESLEKSIGCFRQAIDCDGDYALAYAGLADAYTFLGDVGLTAIQPNEAFTQGKQAAMKALDIDGSLAEAHTSLAHIHMHCYEWDDAHDEFDRALELSPNYAHAHQLYAFYLAFNGRMSEAKLTLQLVLHPGETLETDDGRSVRLDETPQALEVSGWIRHHGWTLKLGAPARLTWPVRPYNPYRNAPETGIEHAVGALTTELEAKPQLVTFAIEE